MAKETNLFRVKCPGGEGDMLVAPSMVERLKAQGTPLEPVEPKKMTKAMADTIKREQEAREKEEKAKAAEEKPSDEKIEKAAEKVKRTLEDIAKETEEAGAKIREKNK